MYVVNYCVIFFCDISMTIKASFGKSYKGKIGF